MRVVLISLLSLSAWISTRAAEQSPTEVSKDSTQKVETRKRGKGFIGGDRVGPGSLRKDKEHSTSPILNDRSKSAPPQLEEQKQPEKKLQRRDAFIQKGDSQAKKELTKRMEPTVTRRASGESQEVIIAKPKKIDEESQAKKRVLLKKRMEPTVTRHPSLKESPQYITPQKKVVLDDEMQETGLDQQEKRIADKLAAGEKLTDQETRLYKRDKKEIDALTNTQKRRAH